MKKFWSRLSVLLIAGAMLFSLAACGGKDDGYNEDGTITIEFFGWGDAAEIANYQTLVNQFMEENKDIIVSYSGENAYDDVDQPGKQASGPLLYAGL